MHSFVVLVIKHRTARDMLTNTSSRFVDKTKNIYFTYLIYKNTNS